MPIYKVKRRNKKTGEQTVITIRAPSREAAAERVRKYTHGQHEFSYPVEKK